MAEPTSRGIQATLLDYFQDTEYFTIQEANELVLDHQNRDVNTESIRARIYEGIDKGLFERVGKGLYTVTRKDEQGRENTCLLINGDGRDLSFLPDNSVDAIVTDHPYDTSKSLKGGNRDFAKYELFQYNEQDFREKLRVLKPGHFLVEFLPEENGDNYQYLFRVKELARKAGFEYYSKVAWQKGDFVANTGRKSKNSEDIVFFSKGKARDLRPDAKKDKQYAATHQTVEYKEHIPGSVTVHYSEMGGLGTSYETKVEPIDVNIRISVLNEDAAKAKELLETAFDNAVIDSFENSPLDIDNGGKYTWEELDEMPVQDYMMKYLDHSGIPYDDLSKGPIQHYMSGAAGMLPTLFNIEGVNKKKKIHQAEKPLELIKQILRFVSLEGEVALDQFAGSGVLGQAALETGRNSILIEKDIDSFHKMRERIEALGNIDIPNEQQRMAINVAVDALEAAYEGPDQMKAFADHQNAHGLPLSTAYQVLSEIPANPHVEHQQDALTAAGKAIQASDLQEILEKEPLQSAKKVLECSSRGDRRFSALFAKVTIKGKEQSIEEWYQGAKRTADGKKAGKGKPFDYILDPFTGDKLQASDASALYQGLWITYLNHNPDLVEYASQFDEFHDMFKGEHTVNSQADVIAAYVRNNEEFVSNVRESHWYKNMASKRKKPTLQEQLCHASTKQAAEQNSPKQMSLFPDRREFSR